MQECYYQIMSDKTISWRSAFVCNCRNFFKSINAFMAMKVQTIKYVAIDLRHVSEEFSLAERVTVV